MYAVVQTGGLYPDVSRILVPAMFSHLPATVEHFGIEQILAQCHIFISKILIYIFCISIACPESNRRQYTKRAYSITRRQTQL